MTKRKLSVVLGAAVSLTLAGFANGQYRVGTDGRALDANNRVGSGGLNAGGPQPLPYGVNGNNIITGDITGGRQFRGFVPYSDPREFRGATAGGLSDRFIRQSSGAPFGGNVSNNAQVVQPFYGSSRFVAPPTGTEQQSLASGAYVPAPIATRAAGDLRLGQVYSSQTAQLPLPGTLVLPGPVDPNTQTSSVLTASPLYGVQKWDLSSSVAQSFLNDNILGNRLNDKLDAATLENMQSELLVQPQETQQDEPKNDSRTLKPLESPDNTAVGGNALTSAALNNTSLAGASATGAGARQRLLTSPRKQSAQYDELARRLEQYKTAQGMSDASAVRQRNEQVRAKQAAEEKAQGKGTAPVPGAGQQPQVAPPQPGVVAQPPPLLRPVTPAPEVAPQPPTAEVPGNVTAPPSDRPAPLQVRSLAEGISAKGLSDVLKEAETLMKDGKYGSALEQYEIAEQVAPNNPLVLMGKANVELAQSYYNRAADHLREALMQNQELLMGQYDLRSWIGNDRLEYVVKELKAISDREKGEAKPVFLLAYIAYNTGNERQAAGYLSLAETRAGGKDPLYPIVRKHWSLPSPEPSAPAQPDNK